MRTQPLPFTDLPFPPELDLHGAYDGYVLTWAGEIIGRFPTLSGAARESEKVRSVYAVLRSVNANENGMNPPPKQERPT